MTQSQRLVYLLGTTHTSQESAKQIGQVFNKEKFDCVLREGAIVRDSSYKDKSSLDIFGKENLVKEPVLYPSLWLYLRILKKHAADMPTIDKLTAQKSIPCFIVDKEFRHLVKDFHRWYNYLIFIGLWAIFAFILHYLTSYGLSTVFGFIFGFLVYDLYFIWRMSAPREIHWSKKATILARQRDFKKILFVCGKLHTRSVWRLLSIKGFKVIQI